MSFRNALNKRTCVCVCMYSCMYVQSGTKVVDTIV